MLPNAEHLPAGGFEAVPRVAVSLDVRRELFCPPPSVGLRARPVGWAAMPEAPIDEHRDSKPRKRNVDSTPRPLDGKVRAVPKAASVKGHAEFTLWSRVCTLLALHPSPRFKGRRSWSWVFPRRRHADRRVRIPSRCLSTAAMKPGGNRRLLVRVRARKPAVAFSESICGSNIKNSASAGRSS